MNESKFEARAAIKSGQCTGSQNGTEIPSRPTCAARSSTVPQETELNYDAARPEYIEVCPEPPSPPTLVSPWVGPACLASAPVPPHPHITMGGPSVCGWTAHDKTPRFVFPAVFSYVTRVVWWSFYYLFSNFCIVIIATARVLPKAAQRELFRLGAWPR